ncbi:MAG: DNA polymerase III subunit alpha, partial [Cyanobacteria bacterium REEB65]|nr:DNA polymerase III subunit alpha [Cyanobacteria bacterium REEB65]
YGNPPPEHVEERLRYELSVITSMGFPAYFLIVWDFIAWAKNNGIPVGPGRGSAAGSLVAYCLGITELDPVRYNLLFERFLNPERVSMPDIDVDICIDRRNEVIRYTREKYGEDRVAQIVTFSTLKAKAAIKDVARVMELPFAESNELAKKVPDEINITLDQAIEKSGELRQAMEDSERITEILDMAKKLEGLTRTTSIHAAGVIIAEEPIAKLVPLQRLKDGDDGGVATQYEQKYCEALGLLKMDFLGLRNLTMIGKALDMIEKNHGVRPDFSDQDFTDPKAYELLQRGESVGIFQVESEGMTKLLKRLKPTCFEDISAVLALYRPGPLESGYVDEYVERKQGKAKIEYPHPALEPILKDTYGTMVYQEQIMQIAQVLAGYSLGGADLLRRAMGKKKKEEMDKQRSIFLEGCAKNDVDTATATDIFSKMEKFSEYCFNRAHTAAYGVLTYQTAYLKAHYPAEYMAALLTSLVGSLDKIMLTILDCHRMGLRVLPPDVNSSETDFSVVAGDIRFGLGAVKNVGLAAVEEILRKRGVAGGRFQDLYDFFERLDYKIVNKKCLESLILCGALDSFGCDRASLLGDDGANLETLCEWASRVQKGASSNQVS